MEAEQELEWQATRQKQEEDRRKQAEWELEREAVRRKQAEAEREWEKERAERLETELRALGEIRGDQN